MLTYNDKKYKSFKKFLILGIGGVSMSEIALVLKNMNKTVVGYDMTRSKNTEIMEKNGIHVYYDMNDVSLDGIDAVAYTAALNEDFPLIANAKEKGIPCLVRAKLLGEMMSEYKTRIGISGCHGKSTTSGMVAEIFSVSKSPTVMVGADLTKTGSGLIIGDTDDFIFEACEYKDSFLSFCPNISVVLNVELDHTDYFKSIGQMKDSFTRYMDIAGENGGVAIVNIDSQNAYDSSRRSKSEIKYFSVQDKNVFAFGDNITVNKGHASFDVYIDGKYYDRYSLKVPGEFQVSNALAAISASLIAGVDKESIKKGIEGYTGVARRFQLRKILNGAEVRDDYAHHPDEIKATLMAASQMGYNNIYTVYQPHTYTRTVEFFDEFTKSFDVCREVIFADIYAAREKNESGISSEKLANATKNGKYVGDFEAIAEYITPKLGEGDLLIIMGAGNIIDLKI